MRVTKFITEMEFMCCISRLEYVLPIVATKLEEPVLEHGKSYTYKLSYNLTMKSFIVNAAKAFGELWTIQNMNTIRNASQSEAELACLLDRESIEGRVYLHRAIYETFKINATIQRVFLAS
jgi:hypothetical protein